MRDVWNTELLDWLKEEVIRRIENAVEYIKSLGEPLHRKKIREIVGLPLYYLNKYPQAKALLSHVQKGNDRKTVRRFRTERILLERVEQVISELETMDSLVTQECIFQMVGLSRQWLFLHPQVKTRLQQFPLRELSSSKPHMQKRKTNRIRHGDEEGLVKQVEHTIKQLNFLGRPLTQHAVCSVVGCSLWKLRSSPRVKEILAQVKVQHEQNTIRLKQQREDMHLILVKQAVEELDLHIESVTLQHISEITGLSLNCLKHTKSIKAFLIKYNEESKEQQQKVQQHEQNLVKLVADTIQLLAAGGRIVTRESISQTIGLSVIHLERYKRVRKLLDPYSGEWRERKQRVQHDEQLLIARIQKAMKRIRARDKFVSLNAIRQMVHLPIGHLHEYPRVKALLQELQIHENSYQEWRLLQFEDNLVRHVEEAIAVLKSQNEAISWLRVSLIIGSPVECLKKYSRVKRLLEQAQEEQKEQGKENKGNEDSLQESILMRDIEQAIVLLRSRGELITPRAIGNIIYLPFHRLDEYPLVKAQLRQIAEQSNGGQSGQILFTEGELIQRVQMAIESLKADGKKVTSRRISRYLQVPLPQLRLLPRVNKILRLIDEGVREERTP